MNIAVLSGKGGTGKTFVSVNLASVIKDCTYVDCDVEEPNGHLFFKPRKAFEEEVCVSLPGFDKEKCVGCRKCVDFCSFNALAFIKNKPFLFEEVCHSCGGCSLVCSENAVFEREHPVGVIKVGTHNQTTVISGIMNAGEESGVPIIRRLMDKLSNNTNIIDCPPGSACTVVESIQRADYCLIVAEPTLFGVHNFMMVKRLSELMGKSFGVVINKDDGEQNPMVRLCREHNLPVLMKIEYDGDIAAKNARGIIAVENRADIKELFEELHKKVLTEVGL